MNSTKRKRSIGMLLAFSLSWLWLLASNPAQAQDQTLTLKEAVAKGLANSKQLKRAKMQERQTYAQSLQAGDKALPEISASIGYSHALMLSQKFFLPGQDKPLELPFDNPLYQANVSVTQPLYTGGIIKMGKQTAEFVDEAQKMEVNATEEDVSLQVVKTYVNLYEAQQGLKVLAQNLDDIQQRLDETQKFAKQGLATRNDVLKFQLAASKVRLSKIEMENNRKMASYALAVLLGAGDSVHLGADSLPNVAPESIAFYDMETKALSERSDLQAMQYRVKASEKQMDIAQAGKLPKLGLGMNYYLINPTSKVFPASGTYLSPLIIGLNLSWNISSFYKGNHVIAKAEAQKDEAATGYEGMQDKVKVEVHKEFLNYQQAIQKIDVLKTAVEQAEENNRIMESKYQNHLATSTDRIDAETMLYSAKLNLEVAKAEAQLAYYQLLKSTGTLTKQF